MFEARDPEFEARVRASFAAQSAMRSLQIKLVSLQPGVVTMQLEKSDHLLQQQSFMHGGVLTAGLDSACGFAALTLSAPSVEVLSIEFKTSFFRPVTTDKVQVLAGLSKRGKESAFARLRPSAWKMTIKFCWQKCHHLLRWWICQKAGCRKTEAEGMSTRRHPDRSVEPDCVAIQHFIFSYMAHKSGELFWLSQPSGERDLCR